MKILKLFGIFLLLLIVIIYMYFPRFNADLTYTSPFWWEKSLFNFCKYQTPEGYKPIDYFEGSHDETSDKNIIFFKNSASGQYLIVSRLRGFHFVPLAGVTFGDLKFKEPLRFARASFFPDFDLVVHQPYIPFLQESNLEKLPKNLLLKGVTVRENKQYATPTANVLYLESEFTKIGFFKKMPFPRGFAAPVFDFKKPQNGIIAIVDNKEKEETLIVVSAISVDKNLDVDGVKSFINSLTFDKDIYKPALLSGKPKITKKYKYSLK